MNVLVIGSGPSGIAAAHALIGRGLDVQMVDGGEALEPAKVAQLATLRQLPPPWTAAQTEGLRGGLLADRRGVRQKRAFGSDFPYRGVDFLHAPATVRAAASLATGGLSHVWGAAVWQWPAADLAGWPVTERELAPHFAALRAVVGLSGGPEPASPASDAACPDHVGEPVRRVLGHWRQQAPALQACGWRAHPSWLAIDLPSCTRCGLCLHGCPHASIWTSQGVLERWRRAATIRHLPYQRVEALREDAAGVAVEMRDRRTGERSTLRASRVFLAAGALPSAWLLATSLQRAETVLQTSQYFLVPFLPDVASPGALRDAEVTLAQAYLQRAPQPGGHGGAHLQLYGPNDIHAAAIARVWGPLAAALSGLTTQLADRLMSFQGYLSSADSPRIAATLRADRLELAPIPHSPTRGIVAALCAELAAQRHALGGRLLRPLLHLGVPGEGAHLGGSWPMSVDPGPYQTDRWGRPRAWQRVHVVDASVLPSLGAATLTWNVMANAHRIAAEVPL